MLLSNALRGFLLFGALLILAHILILRTLTLHDPPSGALGPAGPAGPIIGPALPAPVSLPAVPSPGPPEVVARTDHTAAVCDDFERSLNSPDLDLFFKDKAASAAEEATRRVTPTAPQKPVHNSPASWGDVADSAADGGGIVAFGGSGGFSSL